MYSDFLKRNLEGFIQYRSLNTADSKLIENFNNYKVYLQIMFNQLRYKITSTMLILVILSHITFMHNLVHDYIICYGNDGHIEVENINECDDCTPHSMFGDKEESSSKLSNKDCEDVSLDVNCYEEEQYISQNKKLINRTILKSTMLSFQIENPENTFNQKDKIIFKNKTLENYTTILLLI